MHTDLPSLPIASIDDRNLQGLSLTRLPSGHIRSPWFTFEGSGKLSPEEIYHTKSTYQAIHSASVLAFSLAAGISPFDVLVQVKNMPGEDYFWCLTTRHPQPLPARVLVADDAPAFELMPSKQRKELSAPKTDPKDAEIIRLKEQLSQRTEAHNATISNLADLKKEFEIFRSEYQHAREKLKQTTGELVAARLSCLELISLYRVRWLAPKLVARIRKELQLPT